MHWIAPSEKYTAPVPLEKCLWDAAEQAGPAPHAAGAEHLGARPEGLLDLILLRFTEAHVEPARLTKSGGSGSAVKSAYPREMLFVDKITQGKAWLRLFV
jgi:hypothetical protein